MIISTAPNMGVIYGIHGTKCLVTVGTLFVSYLANDRSVDVYVLKQVLEQ